MWPPPRTDSGRVVLAGKGDGCGDIGSARAVGDQRGVLTLVMASSPCQSAKVWKSWMCSVATEFSSQGGGSLICRRYYIETSTISLVFSRSTMNIQKGS
jgi:hypothetical protein